MVYSKHTIWWWWDNNNNLFFYIIILANCCSHVSAAGFAVAEAEARLNDKTVAIKCNKMLIPHHRTCNHIHTYLQIYTRSRLSIDWTRLMRVLLWFCRREKRRSCWIDQPLIYHTNAMTNCYYHRILCTFFIDYWEKILFFITTMNNFRTPILTCA